jgi:hypothetical protein
MGVGGVEMFILKNGKESIFFPHLRNWNNTIPEQLLEESFHSCP